MKARTREPLRRLKAKSNQWSRKWSGFRFIRTRLRPTKQGKAVGPDAVRAEFLTAGGISLLPHLAKLAARAMAVGVPKSWRGGTDGSYPDVRQRGGQGCGHSSAFTACWASGGGGRRAPTWGGATRLRDETPRGGAFHGLGQCSLLCTSELALGAILTLQKRAQVFDALDIAHEQRVALVELIRTEDTVIKRQEGR